MRDLPLADDRAWLLRFVMLRDLPALSRCCRSSGRVVARHHPVNPRATPRVGLRPYGRTPSGAGAQISAQAGAMVESRRRSAWRRPGCSLRFHIRAVAQPVSAFLAAGALAVPGGRSTGWWCWRVFLPVLAGQSGHRLPALAVTLRGLTLGGLRPGMRGGWSRRRRCSGS
jgi:hypothetical protein